MDVMTSHVLKAGHNGWVDSGAFLPNGHFLASVSGDKTVQVWDLASGMASHVHCSTYQIPENCTFNCSMYFYCHSSYVTNFIRNTSQSTHSLAAVGIAQIGHV